MSAPGPVRPRWRPLLLAGLLIIATTAVYWSYLGQKSIEQAPDFALTSTGFEGGTQGQPVNFTLADYRGRTVVLDFMAVACTSCRVVTDEVLKPLAARQPDAVILSIDTWADEGSGNSFGGETDADIIRLQNQTGAHWRYARDTDQVYLKYAAVTLPKIAVIDPDGAIVYSKTGLPKLAEVEAAVERADAGTAPAVPSLKVGILGLAFFAGVACIFTPCGIGLLPAYMALLVEDGSRHSSDGRVRRSVVGGLAAAAGMAAVYVVLAGFAWLAADQLQSAMPWLGPALGILLAVLGLAALAGADWSLLTRRLPGLDGRRSFAAFGAAYGIAGFACTGPLFLPILVAAFAASPGTGLGALATYTGAVAMGMLGAAILVALGHDTVLRKGLPRLAILHRLSAAILVVGGSYLAWYSWNAYQ